MTALPPLSPWLAGMAQLSAAVDENCEPPPKRGRPPNGDEAVPPRERDKKRRTKERADKRRRIAILDMETDPFDDKLKTHIYPFLAVLYSDEFEPVIIWEENREKLALAVVAAIEVLPGRFTIYAHNGGRFDYMFLIHLLRGEVSFKGRGIMSASIGPHQLRDSFHIVPERLAAFQKDAFDYSKMKREKRNDWREEIIDYCIADCRYLLGVVQSFVERFGFKLSIGQAAMSALREHYNVKRINQGFDAYLRKFYYGGRVECLRGRGHFRGAYKLVDVNSEYPAVMARHQHPAGDFFDYTGRKGPPGADTVFLDLTASNNGALVARGVDGEITTNVKRGRFLTTIWEYETALKWGLIRDIEIHLCLDTKFRTDFGDYILPNYENRLKTKHALNVLKIAGKEGTAEYVELKQEDIFLKLLLNNSYGKFAQNPENYKEHYITDHGASPAKEWLASVEKLDDEERLKYALPSFESKRYDIWEKPNPGFRYHNVGTAASITGAARAMLLDALQRVRGAIYCDTDSIICEDSGDLVLSKTELGAWDLEDEFSEVIIDGKKLYAVWHKRPKRLTPEQIAEKIDPRYTVKSKGASRLTWEDMKAMLGGVVVPSPNRAPTLTRYGTQDYLVRRIRATAPIRGIA